ncbi:MAG: citramalate synthase [Rhodobacteraceae bacterium]|nr:citramalate synthase [Paracoccaceae bacterium]
MAKERIYIYDTTLRDGSQTLGVLFGLEEKRNLTTKLDELGVDYIEGGFPGSNKTDQQYFDSIVPTRTAKIAAFGMTKRAEHSAANDNNISVLANSKAQVICLVGKAHDYHVEKALGISLEENLENIRESITHLVSQKNEVVFDAEHFFDGYKSDETYALKCILEAHRAGARWIVLCDTNGGTLPRDIGRITRAVIEREIPGDQLGIHTHNDTENAVAGTLAAVNAGARQIQGTINGIGERCGNANLISIIGTLLLKEPYKSLYKTNVSKKKLTGLTQISRYLDDILDRVPSKNAAYVGTSAFAHKGGIHGSGVVRNPATYEHIDPESVGNTRLIPLSNQAGKAHVKSWLQKWGASVCDISSVQLQEIIEEIKKREDQGYTYDLAPESCQLLVKRLLNQLPEYFTIQRFRVIVDGFNKANALPSESQAVVTIKIGNERKLSVSEGLNHEGQDSGPVHALSKALKKDLGPYQVYINDMRLIDYKVRIRGSGTAAVTRVVIECEDSNGLRWATTGVSANIIEASFEALVDAIIWKLDHENAPSGSKLTSNIEFSQIAGFNQTVSAS